MKIHFKYLLFVCGCLFLNTGNLLAQKKPVSKKVVKAVAKPVTTSIPVLTFKNGIKMKCKGFIVKEAALYFNDNSKIPEDNKVNVDQQVNMLVVLDTGWVKIDGKVYPGASEVVKLNSGFEVLNSEDLFKAYEETGVSADDAKYITIKAVITKMDDKKKYIIVNFRIWDKKGTGEITGSYQFYIK